MHSTRSASRCKQPEQQHAIYEPFPDPFEVNVVGVWRACTRIQRNNIECEYETIMHINKGGKFLIHHERVLLDVLE